MGDKVHDIAAQYVVGIGGGVMRRIAVAMRAQVDDNGAEPGGDQFVDMAEFEPVHRPAGKQARAT